MHAPRTATLDAGAQATALALKLMALSRRLPEQERAARRALLRAAGALARRRCDAGLGPVLIHCAAHLADLRVRRVLEPEILGAALRRVDEIVLDRPGPRPRIVA